MKFKYVSDEGEVELLSINQLQDIGTLEKGTPHFGTACTFRILEISSFSNGQIENESSPSFPLISSKYSLVSNSVNIPAVIGITGVSESDRLIEVCLTRLHVAENGQFAVACKKSKSSFIINIELVSIEESSEIFDLDPTRVVEIGELLKEEGVKIFSDGFVSDAFYKFSQAFKILNILSSSSPVSSQNLISNLQNNMASCHLKFGNWEETIDLCNLVLDCDEKNVKALYKRGSAFIEIQEYEKAGDDLLRARKLEPGNQAVKNKLALLDGRKKALDAKYAQAMKKFFS